MASSPCLRTTVGKKWNIDRLDFGGSKNAADIYNHENLGRKSYENQDGVFKRGISIFDKRSLKIKVMKIFKQSNKMRKFMDLLKSWAQERYFQAIVVLERLQETLDVKINQSILKESILRCYWTDADPEAQCFVPDVTNCWKNPDATGNISAEVEIFFLIHYLCFCHAFSSRTIILISWL